MFFGNAITIAVKAILANKLRAFMTMLGIIIGISAVITVISVGAGGQSLIVNQIKSIGSNLIQVLPGASEEDGPPASAMGIVVTTLTYDDMLALADPGNVEHIERVAGYVRGVGTLSWQNRSIDANFTGITSGYIDVEQAKLAFGRFISEEEETNNARVAVLGNQVAQDLFASNGPIGQKIKLNRNIFEVIGIFEARGVSGFQNQDTQVFVPLVTAQKLLLGINHISLIRASVDDENNIDQAIEEVKLTLREQHNLSGPREDDFTIRSTKQALDVLGSITSALQFFLAAIAGVSLIVGGIGIMNIMLVNVRERTKEIGLRKAIGATAGIIQTQFLVESLVVTLIGAGIGIVLGAAASALIAGIVQYLGYDWDLVISFESIVLSVGVAAVVGIVFGFYPARQASKLDPIDALRYE